MAKIYISSTYEDLKKEREVTAQALRRLGHQPICTAIKVLLTWSAKCAIDFPR